jgi:Helix-turn-helix domain
MTTPSSNGNGRHKAVSATDRHLANRAINSSDLSSGASRVLLAIADKAGHGCSTCTAKYDTLAKMTNRSRRQVIYHVKALARSDWITIERRRCPLRGDLPNHIRMGPKFAEAVDQQARLEHEEREKKRPNLGQVLDRGAIQCTGGVQSSARGECNPVHPNDSLRTAPSNGKTTTTLSGRAPRVPGCNDDLETSPSSFVASLPESGGTGGGQPPRRSGPPRDAEPTAEAIDRRRLADAVEAVLALGLRRYEGDANPLDAAQAEKLIRGAARKWSGGLRWVAWATHHAAKRRNPAKGRKAAQVWGYIVGTLQRWEQEDSGPPESDGWPGERTASPRKIAEQNSYNPWA